MEDKLLDKYLEVLDYENKPIFLDKYLSSPSLVRLKKVGYFCGMDFASKDIYNFKEYITRYDHSVSCALLTWKCTKNKVSTIAALFHDVATPCFSHVIDYMNKDYITQESTEEYTARILMKDKYLIDCLKEDNILLEDIIDFKKHSIVDNKRPKLCADRLDGVILTGIAWTKNVKLNDIQDIIGDIEVYNNEIGFKTSDTAAKVVDINNSIDVVCHSLEDTYMMQFLADITKYAIDKNYITYDELYESNESDLFFKLMQINDNTLQMNLNKFQNITSVEIPKIEMPALKVRTLNPLVQGNRYIEM